MTSSTGGSLSGHSPPKASTTWHVPIDLDKVQGFGSFFGDDEQYVRSDVLEIWREWRVGTAVQECMVGHGYDWELELPTNGSANVGDVLARYGREGDWGGMWMLSLPVYQYAPNDAMLTGLGDAGSREALGVLYGDLSVYYDYALEFYETTLPDPQGAARASVAMFLEMPRYTSETGDGGILEYAGGCIGQARDALPDFVAIPADVSDAFSATYTVAEDNPVLVQARAAFDQCIDDLGISMAVDPAQMEVIEELEEGMVDAAYGDCQGPYNDVARRLVELAWDQFARDYEPFLTARKESYDELYASLDTDPEFQVFVDLLESQAANAV